MANEREYTVGKGKPHQHTRFQKGQSGNLKGRRKGSKNVATTLEQVLQERVSVTENGKRKNITKLEAMLKQLANKAAAGDHRNLLALHPTVKPAALVADAITGCTSRRDIVLDGFLGSGDHSHRCRAHRAAGLRHGNRSAIHRCYGSALAGIYARTRASRNYRQMFQRYRGCRRQEMNGTKDRNYEIGYGKPPRHTQFRKGQSGNPKGRPRGAKNSATLLNEALDEPVVVTENGRRKTITKKQVIVKQIVNKAAGGDYRSIQLLLLNQIPLLEARLESSRAATVGLTKEETKQRWVTYAQALKILKDLGVEYEEPEAIEVLPVNKQ
jgi:Family of unknown function (DUF5681)/DNA methylase